MKNRRFFTGLINTFLATVVIVVLIVAGVPFFIPIPPLHNAVPPEELAEADSNFITINGITIHYKTAGKGHDTLILIHGFGASTFTWHKVMGPLSQNYTVIAYDMTGFGYTSRPMPGEWSGDNPYCQKSQVEQLIALMDALGVNEAVIVGSSAGGKTAALAAVAHPQRIKALVLVDAALIQGVPPRWLSALMQMPQVKRLGPLIIRIYYTNFFEKARTMVWYDPSRQTPAVLEGYRRPMRAVNWDQALWEYARAYDTSDLREKLRDITVPVLVITGDSDRIVPREASEAVAAEIPHAHLVVIPHTGHLPHEEAPEIFLQTVTTFLEGIGENRVSPLT